MASPYNIATARHDLWAYGRKIAEKMAESVRQAATVRVLSDLVVSGLDRALHVDRACLLVPRPAGVLVSEQCSRRST
mgnify:CR=1 FL=1